MIFDGHSDLLYDVTRRRLAGEKHVLERRHLRNLEAGGVEGLVLALWVSADSFWKKVPEAKDHWDRTEIMLLCMKAELAECPWLTMVRTPAEAEAAKAAGKKYAFLAVEGMDTVRNDLGMIDRYADLGVRVGMLSWNGENLLATGAGGDPYSGLTELGRRLSAGWRTGTFWWMCPTSTTGASGM